MFHHLPTSAFTSGAGATGATGSHASRTGTNAGCRAAGGGGVPASVQRKAMGGSFTSLGSSMVETLHLDQASTKES